MFPAGILGILFLIVVLALFVVILGWFLKLMELDGKTQKQILGLVGILCLLIVLSRVIWWW